jgi:S-adenosylmethionine:tRNA ribosyltransferase-isomerase
VEVLDYDLPEEAIAQEPAEPRHAARLLVDVGTRDGGRADPGAVEHRIVADLPDLLQPGDLLVVNETRVLPARLHLTKATGGAVEVLLLEELGEGVWEGLVRPGRRVPPGTTLLGASGAEVAEVGERLDEGRRLIRLKADPQEHGEIPLPPYIHRPLVDPDRYQTVYARKPGSVAAPTAGLHLTADVLERCRAKGVQTAQVDLAVGLDTFRPITVDDANDHPMHSERYRVPAATWDACIQTRNAGGRVVAVGTTTVRALEAAAATGEMEGRTDLFIKGDYPFAVIDVLLTNFHLPRSSLLLLVEAFCGPRWRALYATALANGYRFLSFGDAMLVDRRPTPSQA